MGYKCHFKNATGEDETTGKVTVKPEPKKEEKKEPSPVADQQPAGPKKSFLAQKKEKAAPEPEKQEEVAVKKKSVGPRKQLPAKEEEPAFGGFKLKKAETVKRGWDDGGLEGVNLKHHEFEKEPEVETPERDTDVLLGDGVPEKDDGKGKKKKKKEPTPEPEAAKEPEKKKTYRELQDEEKARKASLASGEKKDEKKFAAYKAKKKSEVKGTGSDSMSEWEKRLEKPSVPLAAKGPPGPPKIVEIEKKYSAIEEQTACCYMFEGNPAPTFKFFKGTQEIIEGGRYKLIS